MLEPSTDTYEAVKGLRVVRRYQDRPISDEDLEAILEAARWTGSSKNRQSWAFVVIRDRAQIERLAECGDFTGPLQSADAVIVPVRLPDGYDWDLGRASQNIMLAAAAVGVGSCPITFHRHDDARRVLGVPDDHGCKWGIALGYPDPEAERQARERNPLGGRKPLDQLVRRERFS
ncbi:MAG: nitroreductase [Acidimicrobiia bacterium]|nr:nitroreductase [Acidimicrobiia bacterium]